MSTKSTARLLLLIKHQAADLNELPCWGVFRTRGVQGCRMRRQTRLAFIRVETLDQSNLIWCLSPKVVPLVRGVIANTENGPLSVPIYVPGRDKVFLRIERTPICQGEWVVRNGVPDRAPHVDDARTALEKAIRVFGGVLPYPGDSRSIGLVDVHACLESAISRD
jgi:hypothetical protein